jgi:Holliday junction resolvasome RuvABC endonuclease subunit
MARKKIVLPRIILAIDPAKAAGFALYVDRKLIHYGAVDGSTWRTMAPVFATAVADLPADFERVCVVEDGFITRPFNAKGVLTLGRRRGLAQAAAEAAGFEKFEYIGPSTWQNTLFGPLKGRDTKDLSMAYAAGMGALGISHDEADAICLGAYYLQALDMELKSY